VHHATRFAKTYVNVVSSQAYQSENIKGLQHGTQADMTVDLRIELNPFSFWH